MKLSLVFIFLFSFICVNTYAEKPGELVQKNLLHIALTGDGFSTLAALQGLRQQGVVLEDVAAQLPSVIEKWSRAASSSPLYAQTISLHIRLLARNLILLSDVNPSRKVQESLLKLALQQNYDLALEGVFGLKNQRRLFKEIAAQLPGLIAKWDGDFPWYTRAEEQVLQRWTQEALLLPKSDCAFELTQVKKNPEPL